MSLRALFFVLMVAILAGCSSGSQLYTNIDNDELQQLLAQGIPLYDIRRPDEWQQTGVIHGSRRLTFIDGKGQVSPDFLPRFSERVGKGDPVILICRTGNRTTALARHLTEKMGYTHVYNVTKGITGWIGEKRELSRF